MQPPLRQRQGALLKKEIEAFAVECVQRGGGEEGFCGRHVLTHSIVNGWGGAGDGEREEECAARANFAVFCTHDGNADDVSDDLTPEIAARATAADAQFQGQSTGGGLDTVADDEGEALVDGTCHVGASVCEGKTDEAAARVGL